MAGTARRRLIAAAAALTGALTLTGGLSLVARGATAPTGGWGTFVQVATKDLADAATRQAVAQSYSTVVLRGALTPALVTDLRQRRDGIVLLAYEKAAGLSAGDLRTLGQQHADWIARDSQGAAIHPRGIPDTTLADLTNPAFRGWQARQMATEVQTGVDGAFIDTLGAYFPSDFYTARPIVAGAPVTDAAWRDGSVNLISRVKALTGKPVIANGFGLGSGQAYYRVKADADRLITAADGVQIEGFTRWGGARADDYRKRAQWDLDLSVLESLGARGKTVLAYTKVDVNAGPAQLAALRDYALGSFLLAFAPGKASFGFDDGKRIPSLGSDPPWARSLGAPTGSRSRLDSRGWQRPFGAKTLMMTPGAAPAVN
jgi:hypothetical protein